MAVIATALATAYKGYSMDERACVITPRACVGASVGTSTNRVGPRPARPTRPAGLGWLADLKNALDLDDLPEPTTPPTRATTPTRSVGRPTAALHRKLDLAERRIP